MARILSSYQSYIILLVLLAVLLAPNLRGYRFKATCVEVPYDSLITNINDYIGTNVVYDAVVGPAVEQEDSVLLVVRVKRLLGTPIWDDHAQVILRTAKPCPAAINEEIRFWGTVTNLRQSLYLRPEKTVPEIQSRIILVTKRPN